MITSNRFLTIAIPCLWILFHLFAFSVWDAYSVAPVQVTRTAVATRLAGFSTLVVGHGIVAREEAPAIGVDSIFWTFLGHYCGWQGQGDYIIRNGYLILSTLTFWRGKTKSYVLWSFRYDTYFYKKVLDHSFTK